MTKTRTQMRQKSPHKPSKGIIVTIQFGENELTGIVINTEGMFISVTAWYENGRQTTLNNIPHKSDVGSEGFYWDYPKGN